MTTDYRALCAELTNELSGYKMANPMHDWFLLNRARAALAAEPVLPAEGEVAELVAWLHGQDGGIGKRAIYSRVADLLERLAPEPDHFVDVPKMVEPDDGEVAEPPEAPIWLNNAEAAAWQSGWASAAADLLERLTPQPVPEGQP